MLRTNTAVWLENQNRWQIKVQKDGVRRTFTSSIKGRNGQRECNRKADAWLDDSIVSMNKSVSSVFEDYLAELKLTTSKSHYVPCESHYKTWIQPNIGSVKVRNLTEQHFQTIINKAYKSGLARKSLSNIRATLMSFLKYCRRCKYTTLMCENIHIPQQAKKGTRTILQPSDLTKLFESDTTLYKGKEVKDYLINAYRFEVITGVRPGELIGLKWSDIKNDIVYIQRSVNRFDEVTSGKNENAVRQFALTSRAKDILENQKKLCDEYDIDSEYVFFNYIGARLTTNQYYNQWVRYRDYNGISKSSPYELRHTFVSVAKTLPLGLVKSLVGHSENMDTLGIYSHQLDGEMQKIADIVQSVFEEYI